MPATVEVPVDKLIEIDQLRADIAYLRDRTDRIYDHVLKGKRTDWVAIGTFAGVAVVIVSAFIEILVGRVYDNIDVIKGRVAVLESKADAAPAKMEAIAKNKADQVILQLTHKIPVER